VDEAFESPGPQRRSAKIIRGLERHSCFDSSRRKTEHFGSGFLALTAPPTESLGKRWACQNIDIMVLVAMKMDRQDNFAHSIEKTSARLFRGKSRCRERLGFGTAKAEMGECP
jgi:hypothetical protein